MYFEEEIKVEDASEDSLCFACLSSTRKLASLGEYTGIFEKFFDYESSPDLRPISLCWECMAILRKVKLFKEKVDHAQSILSYHHLTQDTPPTCLSNLVTTKVETSNFFGTKLNADDAGLKICETEVEDVEIKEEGDFDSQEYDERLDNDDTETGNFELNSEVKPEPCVNSENDAKDQSKGHKGDVKKGPTRNNKRKIEKETSTEIAEDTKLKTDLLEDVKKGPTRNNKRKIEKETSTEIAEDTKLKTDLLASVTRPSFTRITSEMAVLLNAKLMCPKKPRKSATYAQKKFKKQIANKEIIAKMNKDADDADTTTALKKKVSKNEASDPDFKLTKEHERHLPPKIPREENGVINVENYPTAKRKRKHVFNYKWKSFRPRSEKVKAIEVLVAVDELRMLMKKDSETEVFKQLKSKCELCVKSIRPETMNYHKQEHSKTGGKHHCEICDVGFYHERKLRSHRKSHTKALQCSECGFKCHLPELMEKHVWKHNFKMQCVTCHSYFKDKAAFFKHYQACDHCGKSFKKKTLLEKHIIKSHISHQCKECNMKFISYRAYKYHVDLKHTTTEKKEDAYCVTCNLQFLNDKAYLQHVNTSAAHAGEKAPRKEQVEKVKCLECPITFCNKAVMMHHYRFVHQQDYRFKCNLCGKAFVKGNTLSRHIESVHEGLKPPKNKFCNICGRGFSTVVILRNHIRTHTGERPYQCEHCESRFAQRVALTQHVKFVHLKQRRSAPSVEASCSNESPIPRSK